MPRELRTATGTEISTPFSIRNQNSFYFTVAKIFLLKCHVKNCSNNNNKL